MTAAVREFLFISIGVLILSGGCDTARRVASSLGELKVVRTDVAKFLKLEEEAIGVSIINRAVLVVTLINSPLRGANETERKGAAKDVAGVAYRSYPDRADLTRVDIVLLTSRTYLVVNTSSTKRLAFPVSELSSDRPPTGVR